MTDVSMLHNSRLIRLPQATIPLSLIGDAVMVERDNSRREADSIDNQIRENEHDRE